MGTVLSHSEANPTTKPNLHAPTRSTKNHQSHRLSKTHVSFVPAEPALDATVAVAQGVVAVAVSDLVVVVA